jgi:hypothetical protein
MTVRRVPSAALHSFLFFVLLGAGAWAVRAADPLGEKELFAENFTDAPGKDWSWLREVRDHWKIDKEKQELLIRPVWAVNGLKNMPFREIPDGKGSPVAIEVHVSHVPKADYEVSGLMLYFDDENFVNFQRELMGDAKTGKVHLFMWGSKAGKKLDSPKHVIYSEPDIDLRMVLTGKKVEGWYRASSTEKWQSFGEMELPGKGAAKIGLRTNNGEEEKPSWVRFSKFRILQLGD